MRILHSKRYHRPASVEQLTSQNVKTILELEQAAQAHRSMADAVADFITRFCGSISFVGVHVVWFGVWIGWNLASPSERFDPFPYSLLTMIVSLEAIFLSSFILISDNRQAKLDERRNQLDLQINLLTEQENTKMLTLLKHIAEKVGVDPNTDPTVAVLEQATRPDKLLEQIDDSVKQMERRKGEES